jgi:hypothetical protein
MKPKPTITWLLVILISSNSMAQQKDAAKEKRKLTHIGIAFTNSHTAVPFGSFSKLVTGNYHPGIELSTGFNWKTKKKHNWIQTFNAGYSYHRWVQHSIVLYTEFGYRYRLPAGFSAEAKLGGGYMRAIVATEVFSDGVEDGEQYEKISSGRSQAIVSLGFNLSKEFKKLCGASFFLEYQQRIQTPFIQSYVPLLPYNIMKAGVRIPFKR